MELFHLTWQKRWDVSYQKQQPVNTLSLKPDTRWTLRMLWSQKIWELYCFCFNPGQSWPSRRGTAQDWIVSSKLQHNWYTVVHRVFLFLNKKARKQAKMSLELDLILLANKRKPSSYWLLHHTLMYNSSGIFNWVVTVEWVVQMGRVGSVSSCWEHFN